MRLALVILTLYASIGMSQEYPSDTSAGVGLGELFTDPAGRDYFPKGKASYYTRYLAAMNEPSILDDLPEGVVCVYRLTILPSFTDRISVRITNRKGIFEMRSVQLKCDENHLPDKIVHDETKILDAATSDPLIRLLSSEDLWIGFTDLEQALMDSVRDGVTYVLEKRTAEGYTLIDPSTPLVVVQFVEENPNFTKRDFRMFDQIAERMKNAAGLPVESE